MSNEDHDNDTCPNYATATRWMSAYGYCVTENKRLSAENADLKDRLDKAENQVEDLEIENARLKAEVERLQDFNDGLMAMRLQDEKGNLLTAADYNRLKAEVERLTKAGDRFADIELAKKMGDYEFDIDEYKRRMNDWNAAKEGKQTNG